MRAIYLIFALMMGISLVVLSACASENRESRDTQSELIQPETVLENDYVHVVKISLDPGMELVPHEGAVRLIYSINDYTIEWVVNDESQGEKSWTEGDIHVHGPDTHSAINIGSETAEWLAFSRKEMDLPDSDMQSLENDVNSVGGEFAEMIFNNESFRVTEVRLAPGESIPTHEGIHRIIYSMSDYVLEYESEETGLIERSFEAGEAHWHVPGTHMMRNIGDTEAYFLVVSYK